MAAPCKSRSRQARVLALFAALVVAGPAGGNPGNGQTFKNWTARCEMPAGADRERCFIFQNLVLKESGERVVHVAVGYLAADGRPAAVVTMPLGIALPPGATISVDGGAPETIVIERCDTNGCVGALALSDHLIAEMKRGREAHVGFYDGSRRRISVPVSLLGFTAGFNALDP